MARGCFGMFAGFVALFLLATTFGCGQAEKTAANNSGNESSEEKSECCGGCCGEETTAAKDECCGKCEEEVKSEEKSCCGKCKEEEEEVKSQEKECCGKCEQDSKSLASTAAKSKAAEPCEYCKGEKACAECEKELTSVDLKTAKQLADSTGKKSTAAGKEPVNSMRADRDVFHYLLKNHEKISREVTILENGVKTVTQSDVPEITSKIQEHVASMKKRVEQRRPLRMWDELFQEIFKHADKIEMKVKNTEKGAEVIETSSDPKVVKLIQQHAKVVTGFTKRGFDEAHKNHVPETK